MSALTVDLMGSTPLDEATIQARAQDIIAADWPAWKRERALRLGDPVKIAALNAYMDEIAAEVDQSRADSDLLRTVIAFEQAQTRLLLPLYDGPATIETEDGVEPHPDQERDDEERAAAQAVLDTAPDAVIALAIARIPPEPEPEPEPEFPGMPPQ